MGFITPSQTFDIAIIFEKSPKKHAYFGLYNAIWVHLNVSIGVANPDRHWHVRPNALKLNYITNFSHRETGFITPSQTFDIAIIFERSQKKHAYFGLYNAIWVHLNVSVGVYNPAPNV